MKSEEDDTKKDAKDVTQDWKGKEDGEGGEPNEERTKCVNDWQPQAVHLQSQHEKMEEEFGQKRAQMKRILLQREGLFQSTKVSVFLFLISYLWVCGLGVKIIRI